MLRWSGHSLGAGFCFVGGRLRVLGLPGNLLQPSLAPFRSEVVGKRWSSVLKSAYRIAKHSRVWNTNNLACLQRKVMHRSESANTFDFLRSVAASFHSSPSFLCIGSAHQHSACRRVKCLVPLHSLLHSWLATPLLQTW